VSLTIKGVADSHYQAVRLTVKDVTHKHYQAVRLTVKTQYKTVIIAIEILDLTFNLPFCVLQTTFTPLRYANKSH
jgi:hypothetical protein